MTLELEQTIFCRECCTHTRHLWTAGLRECLTCGRVSILGVAMPAPVMVAQSDADESRCSCASVVRGLHYERCAAVAG